MCGCLSSECSSIVLDCTYIGMHGWGTIDLLWGLKTKIT